MCPRVVIRTKSPDFVACLIRAMLLDGMGADYGLPAEHPFRPDGVKIVVIVENLRSFLTLPTIPGVLALWGEGHAARLLASLPWLGTVDVFSWGDMDPHGYAILNGLRTVIPKIRSFLSLSIGGRITRKLSLWVRRIGRLRQCPRPNSR